MLLPIGIHGIKLRRGYEFDKFYNRQLKICAVQIQWEKIMYSNFFTEINFENGDGISFGSDGFMVLTFNGAKNSTNRINQDSKYVTLEEMRSKSFMMSFKISTNQ